MAPTTTQWSAELCDAGSVGVSAQQCADYVLAQPVKEPTEAQKAKTESWQELEAAWRRRVTLGRWNIELGLLDREVVLNYKTLPTEESTEEPPAKKFKLSKDVSSGLHNGIRVNGSPKDSHHKIIAEVQVKPDRSEFSQGFRQNGKYQIEVTKVGHPALRYLFLRIEQSDREGGILRSLLELLTDDTKCSIRTIASLAITKQNRAYQLSLNLDLCAKDTAHLEDAFVHTNSPLKLRATEHLFRSLYPSVSLGEGTGRVSPRTFYDAVHVPDPQQGGVEDLEVPGLQTVLYPFQTRSVKWMLQREHHVGTSDPSSTSQNGFQVLDVLEGRQCYFNPLLWLFTTNLNVLEDQIAQLRGGILAEEMGLGKTVELISLMQLNKRHGSDMSTPGDLHPTGATLIVAPKTIIQQWKGELERHCPELRVLLHEGFKPSASGKSEKSVRAAERELVRDMVSYDVVLIEYAVLATEVNVALAPRERSRRAERVYERRRSVFVQIDWWRVILDEAQLIESGTTKAAQVALQIPRQNAWAVTGTPLKKEASDLYGLFLFLGLRPYSFSEKWFRQLTYNFSPWYTELISRTTLRHTKDLVRGELQLPPQKRVIITVPFTAIEEQNYNQLFEQMASECGLLMDGSPADERWDPEDPDTLVSMRGWLERLRKVCLHPEVYVGRRRVAGREGPLRTVEEVLSMMTDANETSLRTEERVRLQSMLKRGQMLENAKHPEEAMAIWQKVEGEVVKMVDEDRKALDAELARVKTLEAKATEKEGEEDSLTPRLSGLRNRLRASLELQHSVVFFIANAIYQVKTDENLTKLDSDVYRTYDENETRRYEEAKAVRRELLSTASEQVLGILSSIRTRVSHDNFVKIKAIKDLPVTGGLETRKHTENVEDILDVMNQQAELIDGWRESLAKLVLLPLVDQEESELTGEEYEKSTQEEDKIHAYMEALRLIIADRGQVISGQRNLNVRREAALLHRKAVAGEGHAPELMRELLVTANKTRPAENKDGDIEIYLRGVIPQLNQLRSSLEAKNRSGEIAIVESMVANLRVMADNAAKNVVALEKELDLFSDAVNARVEFFRQLQIISDLVRPFEEEMTEEVLNARLRKMEDEEHGSLAKASRFRGRATFLQHLKTDPNKESEERRCPICTDTFDNGVLTRCGHPFCKDCIMLWWSSHKSCPTCKQSLAKTDLYPITYKPIHYSAHEDQVSRSPSVDAGAQASPMESQDNGIYTGIDRGSLDEIKSIDLPKSFGTKIDTLARHIIWLHDKEPGAKAVVFSQFKDFFNVLQEAFDTFKIGWASMEKGRAGVERFKKDSAVEVLLLHAKSQASGLNLTNATHVFLCEPLINTAIELQAIARIHRIGQNATTTVWQYLIENTVEKAIYDISVDRRLSHLQSSAAAEKKQRSKEASKNGKRAAKSDDTNDVLEAEFEAANSIQIEAPMEHLLAKGTTGGEQVANKDLWPCLFNHRPHVNALAEEAEKVANGFLAANAAEERRAEMTLRPSGS